MSKFLAGVTIVALVAMAGEVFLQRETNAELRAEIAALRADVQQVAQQRAQARQNESKPAVADDAVVTARQNADRAELAKLRADLMALKSRTEEIAKVAAPGNGQPPAAAQSTVPVKLIPASVWKNAGKATPSATVETLLWAATGGDVKTVTNSIVLDPAAEVKAQALFAQLPDASRATYGSPDELVALLLAKDASAVSSMQVLGQRDMDPGMIGVRVRLADESGQIKEQGMPFQQTADGWRLQIVEKTVDKFAQTLTGAPAPQAKVAK